LKTSLSRVARVSRVRESGWPNNPANLAVGDLPTKTKPYDDSVSEALKFADETFLSWRITLAVDRAIGRSRLRWSDYQRSVMILVATAEVLGRGSVAA